MMEPMPSNPNSPTYLSSDLDMVQKREDAAQHALEEMQKLMTNANNFLGDVESEGMLGTAIIRGCQELADAVGELATDLEQHNDEQALARACLEDCQRDEDSQELVQGVSETDMIQALAGAKDLLRDVEASLRSIDQRDAEEIADVALTLAKLFVMSLQDVLSQIDAKKPAIRARSNSFSDRIEVLGDGDDEPLLLLDEQTDEPKLDADSSKRVRCLWPPLGPAVVTTCEWSKNEATKQPLLAAALGLTMWPAAIVAAFFGPPIILADTLVQHVYNHFSEAPLITALERGAAQVVQATKLGVLCSGLVARQTLRVAGRQVERQGGWDKIAKNVGHAALDRVTHPIETVCMAWDGVKLGAGAVKDAAGFVQEVVEREIEKSEAAKMQ